MRRLTACLLPLRIILVVILSPFITVVYISLVVFLGIPSHLFRKFVAVLARSRDRDLCKLVTAKGSVTSRDFSQWYTEPCQSINTMLAFKGHVELDQLQQRLLDTIVNRRSPKGGHLEYPEFQQYCTKRMGYLFWKWNRKFAIENHVTLYQSEQLLPNPGKDVVDDEKFIEILDDVGRRPYMPKTSPWEVILVPNYVPNKENQTEEEEHFALIVRTQHGLTDGISMSRVLAVLTDGTKGLEMWENMVRRHPPPTCFAPLMHLTALFLGPTAFLWGMLKGPDSRNGFHLPLRKKVGHCFSAKLKINFEVIKKGVRANPGSSVQSVLLAGVTGGMRNYLIKNRIRIPFAPIRAGVPIPLPGHSEKLRNEFMASTIDLPVHKKTRKERVLALEKSFGKVRSGALAPFLTETWTLIGGLPIEWVRKLTNKSGVSIIYSELKGPTGLLTAMDGKCVMTDFVYNFSMGTDDLGTYFSAISYNGKITLLLTVDKSIINERAKVVEFLNLIAKEMEEFQYGDCNNI